MTDQQEAWRERQQAVLTALRKASNRNRTEIAKDVGLEYWQIVRLETGKARLPADLIPKLAAAYGVTPQKLIDDLGLSKVADLPAGDAAIMRRLLEAAGVDEDRIRDAVAEVTGRGFSPAILRHAAEVVIEAAERDDDQRRRAAT